MSGVTLTAVTQEATPAQVDDNTKCTITVTGMAGTILFRNGTDGDDVFGAILQTTFKF